MSQSEAQPAVEAVAEAPEVVLGEHGEMTFEQAMAAASAQADGATETPVEALQDEAPTEVDPEVPKPLEAIEAPPEESQADTRSLARIMEKESALAEKQAAYDSAQTELDSLRTRLDHYEGSQAAFRQDPISFIRALAPDMDLKRLAETAWNEQLGDQAPPEYQKQKVASRHNSELAERIAKMEQAEQARQQSAHQNEAQRGLNQYLGSLTAFAESVDQGSLPLVAAMQQRDPQDVARGMEDIARAHARQTNGQVLTPGQVAEAYEKRLAKYQLAAPPVNEPPPPAEQGTSLRNSSTQVQPDREPVDEMSDEFLRAKAMKAIGVTNY